MTRRRLMAIAAAFVVMAATADAAADPVAAFDIGLIGDTGYSTRQDELLLTVRRDMARFPLAFVVHDGDIQRRARSQPCNDARLWRVRDVFDGFAAPFVYTPGDNEWADCPYPWERLEAIRRIFFPTDGSLGQRRITLQRQSSRVENARWSKRGVYFATINLPGHEGHGISGGKNLAWLHGTFDAAEADGAAGVMIIWQDNPFLGDGPSKELLRALVRRARDFRRPVVLVHGDSHFHRIDRPRGDAPNLVRVETYADKDAHRWIRATVDPSTPGVFRFTSQSAH